MRAMRFTTFAASALCSCAVSAFAQAPVSQRPFSTTDSPRMQQLMRAGNLYLSLKDALALAVENNLAVELQRFNMAIGEAEVLRASGGGITRGLNLTVLETPNGVGGPSGQVVLTGASGRATSGTSVATNALQASSLSEPQSNLSIQGTVPQSNGTAVPNYDRAITGQLNWNHQTTLQTTMSYGVPALAANTTLANAGVQQAFSSGAQASLTFNNNRQTVNALTTLYATYTNSNLGLTVTQPLLRGFGSGLNRRFIRIAGNERRITSLLFRQQLTATVYGVVRLYTDFIALFEDEKVKQETADLALKLMEDVRAQVDEGTLAPIELTRATAQVYSTRQDLITAGGLREEQEALLKNVLTRTGNQDPALRDARIIPTDTLSIPEAEAVRPIQEAVQDALARRPDLGQARLQIENSQIGLEGAKNATLPQVDLVGIAQNNGLGGVLNPFSPNQNGPLVAGYGGILEQLFSRKYPTYGVGLQVSLPLRNRVAEADLARDQLQMKQSQIRLTQAENQARLEVEDATIAMRRARAAYDSATRARQLQEESLAAEQAKFEAGASTSFFVIQYESMLAQARSTEVAAKSSYVKARAALARATGTILEEYGISESDAAKAR